jgi:hypothetical protein
MQGQIVGHVSVVSLIKQNERDKMTIVGRKMLEAAKKIEASQSK